MKPKSYREQPEKPCARCKHRRTAYETSAEKYVLGNVCDCGKKGKWPDDKVGLFGTCDEFKGRADEA